MQYSDDYIILFLSTENNKTINIRYTTENKKNEIVELKTEKEFSEFFDERKVMILFIDDVDIEPVPDTLSDKVFNGGLMGKIDYNRGIRYDYGGE